MNEYDAFDKEHNLKGANSLWFWHMSIIGHPGYVGYTEAIPTLAWDRNPASVFENLSQWDDDELNAPGFGMWFRVSVDSLRGWWDPEYRSVGQKIQAEFRKKRDEQERAEKAYLDHHPETALANYRAGREVWDTNGDQW